MKHDDTNTTLRRWTTIRQIPRTPESRTTAQIWQRVVDQGFDVSKRTVERDLEIFSTALGFTAEPHGRTNKWSWKGQKIFDVPGIEPLAALAWVMSEQFMGQHLPASAVRKLEPYFETARAVLDSQGSKRPSRWREKFLAYRRGPDQRYPEVDPGVRDTIHQAVLDGSRLTVRHRSRKSEQSIERDLHPLGVVLRAGIHYLVAVVHGETVPKQFAMHRIESAQARLADAEAPEDFDLKDFARQSFGYGAGREIRLVIRLNDYDARHLGECPLSGDQRTKALDGMTEVSATVVDSSELLWWLLGYGDRIEVIRPKALRAKVRDVAVAMAEMYSPDA